MDFVRQTLFYIPSQLGPLPIFGFGWALIFFFIASLILMTLLIRRHGWGPEVRGYLPTLTIVGLAIAFVLPALEQPGLGLPIRGYGVMMLLAVVSGVGLSAELARRMGVDQEVIISLAFWVFIGGIIGARVFYVIEYYSALRGGLHQPSIGQLLFTLVNFSQGGLVVYGALIGAAMGFAGFTWRFKLPALAVADLAAPGMALGQAIGRIGCLLSGCCFGGVCELPWAVTFPWGSAPFVRQIETGQTSVHGLLFQRTELDSGAVTEGTSSGSGPAILASVESDSSAYSAGLRKGDRITRIGNNRIETADQARYYLISATHPGETIDVEVPGKGSIRFSMEMELRRSLPVHPTQIYSAIDAFLLCLVLLAYQPFRRHDGEVMALLLTLHPISRFLLESIRTDEAAVWGTGMSISQVLSLGILVLALGLWGYIWSRPAGSILPVARGNTTQPAVAT